jgi:RNA recognition motif-containing protein
MLIILVVCLCFGCGSLLWLQVTDIRLITDRHTKRSKGLAYVEFSRQEEVFAALTLTGQVNRLRRCS